MPEIKINISDIDERFWSTIEQERIIFKGLETKMTAWTIENLERNTDEAALKAALETN